MDEDPFDHFEEDEGLQPETKSSAKKKSGRFVIVCVLNQNSYLLRLFLETCEEI